MNEMMSFFESIREAEKIRSLALQQANPNPAGEDVGTDFNPNSASEGMREV